ncbi:hypothetical protein QNI19_38875 [Cytophagaceae bacterium DM2B3-1]|uniref:Uncharacterized protein n=1 Tax=Xanthocytophaga flava TaxID=3048013 RepID=A0ABT7CYZ1_9BACT|nr:hypothetical protein [Xanthocytophaga flavus]MDJ1498955.1 hypothetical protein [Xanthocytophaga flavus]
MKYTLIYDDLLEHFDIDMYEHALLSLIDGLSVKTGWCFASREEMAKRVRMGSRWIFKALHQLTNKGLIEVDDKSRFIRASKTWKDAFRKCQKEGGLLANASDSGTEPDIEMLFRKHKHNIQLKYRESVHDSADDSYAQTTQEPVNTIQAEGEDYADTMQFLQPGYAQNSQVSMQDMHTSQKDVQTGSENNAEAPGTIVQSVYEQKDKLDMHDLQSGYAQNAHYNNIYSNNTNNTYNNKDNNTIITEKSACAQDLTIGNQEEFSQKEQAGEREENFFKGEKENQPVVEAAIVTPPQVAPAPSPKKAVQKEKAMQNVHSLKTDSKATSVDPCLIPCREAYLLHFRAYKWVYGRDDKFLKQVLEQIRYKIAIQWQQPDMNLAEIPDESVIHSFQSLLEKIPTWYRDNGHTTPNDLNRFFEKYYAAIKSGNGGGDRGPFAPLQDQEYETVQLLLQSRGRHNR